ncbi:MAG: bifunctional diguanylate cyclase/phosphodiesterase [Rubellimicrobium sp.]|nr:bifunctional diguanylate cyclase/phosphodiesterase [Rubellimicrobium sp.]
MTVRDTPKRLAALALIFATSLQAGAGSGLLPFLVAVLACEAAAMGIALSVAAARRRARPMTLRSIGNPRTAIMWAINVTSTAFYLAPAIILAGVGTVPMLLAAMLWVFGVLVHLTNSFVALPLFNRSQLVPAAAMALATFQTAYRTASGIGYGPGSTGDWLIATALIAVYFANSIETIHAKKDTQQALDRARADAQERLVALERASRYDALTGALNRRAFDDVLAGWLIARNDRNDRNDRTGIAVLVIDLDGFKPVNDTYSHAAGDAVLVAVARRLSALAGPDGVVARLGGDEFVVALRYPESEGGILDLAQAMRAAICEPVAFGERALSVDASVGIATARPVLASVAALCGAADMAMFAAKSEGGGRVVLHDPAIHRRRATLEDRRILAEALRLGDIRPHYQPKVSLASGRIIGIEALARWIHPVRGLILPDDFLPQVNDLGLQGDFQNAITRQVMRDTAALLRRGLDPGAVSLNISEAALATISGRQELEALIAAVPGVAGRLTLEITEDVFIARAGGTIQANIAHLRGAGLRMALDDFGTGFASFQHLRQLEFDEVKIDRSFVADLGRSEAAAVLIAGFIAIARGLGVAVVAEGVETEEQRSALVRLGCPFGQGFLFHPPLPLEELVGILPGLRHGPATAQAPADIATAAVDWVAGITAVAASATRAAAGTQDPGPGPNQGPRAAAAADSTGVPGDAGLSPLNPA